MNLFTGLKVPKVIFETSSELNEHIQVVQIGNTRKIKVDDIEQSISHTSPMCERLYWGKVIEVVKKEVPELKKALIFGFGGGTIAHLLSQNFAGAEIIGVELDPVMVEIARDYFDIGSIPNLRVIIEDALRVAVAPGEYNLKEHDFDMLLVDVYVGQKYPDLGKSGNFIGSIKKLVKPGGLIIFNRIYREDHQDDVNIFIDYVSEFFDNVKNLVVAGYTNSDNVLIYAKT